MIIFQSILLLIQLFSITCHMEMRLPPPRRSKYNNDYQALGDIDNDMPAPLGDDFPFPCRGTKPGPIYKKYKAGDNIDIILGGNAPHNGGHCQFALSYDGGEKWVVIYTIVRTCMPAKTGPIEFQYQVPLPADIPSSENVVFSWNWINASGEREFYMNCIDIAIEGNSDSKGVKGKELLVVNLPTYPTIEEFGRPGSYDGSKLLDKRKNITMLADGSIIDTVEGAAAPAPAPSSSKPSASKPSNNISISTVTVTVTGPAKGLETSFPTSSISPFISNSYEAYQSPESSNESNQDNLLNSGPDLTIQKIAIFSPDLPPTRVRQPITTVSDLQASSSVILKEGNNVLKGSLKNSGFRGFQFNSTQI